MPTFKLKGEKMKKYFLLLLPLMLMADSTFFSGSNIKLGGYGGPSVKVININSKTVVLSGGSGAFAFNDNFSLGGFGYGNNDNNHNDKNITNSFSGIIFGYNVPTTSSYSPSLSILLGHSRFEGVQSTMVNINLGVQLKMFEWLRIEPNIGYAQTDIKLGGLAYGLNFMFGYWNK